MASKGKKKTTMAKLNREAKLRDKQARKQMRKDERKRATARGEAPWLAPDFDSGTGV